MRRLLKITYLFMCMPIFIALLCSHYQGIKNIGDMTVFMWVGILIGVICIKELLEKK